ncbi:MAG: tyrosine-type recombinase/integrase [Actinobacteria bacterium]|nr:tyrosine-type recombinase/integrase [Actinomycetota bacterium]
MSIHKRTAGKQTKYDVKLRRPDGTQYQKSFNTKKQAEAYEAQQLVEHNNGTWLDDRYTNITFEQMATRWLESNNAKRQTSLTRDIGILNKHLIPAIGSRQIKTIKRSDISAMVNTWVIAKLSPATIRRHIAVSSAIFNMAIADDILHKSPTLKVSTPRVDPSHGRALTATESELLLSHIPQEHYALVFTMLTTGLRWSEAVGLQVKHFSPMTPPPTLTVEQGIHETGRGYVIEKPKSAASHRVIVLHSKHVEVIARYLQDTNRSAVDAEAPLFISQKGGRLVSSNFRNRIWQPAVKAAGLEGLQIKDLRKTAATNLLQSGADSKTVTAILGHEDIRTTLNHYAKTTPESLANAAQVLVDSVSIRDPRLAKEA